MSDAKPNRLDDARLDADLSVLGDDQGGDSKIGRLGGAPAPDAKSPPDAGSEDIPPQAGSGGRSVMDNIDQERAAKESARDVVDGYGKS